MSLDENHADRPVFTVLGDWCTAWGRLIPTHLWLLKHIPVAQARSSKKPQMLGHTKISRRA